MGKGKYQLKTYKDDYDLMLGQIIGRLPLGYLQWSSINNIDPKDYTLILDSVLHGVNAHILKEADFVFAETKSKISNYINTFEVAPNQSIDEFKLVFFIAMTLADSLVKKGLHRESKMVLSVMVWILDYRLLTVHAKREKLTSRIVKMIERDRLKSETGEVGLYLIYKCLFNQAMENRPQDQ